jgi:hypothetical protein
MTDRVKVFSSVVCTGGYTVQVIDYYDTWVLDTPPGPDWHHVICFRVMKDVDGFSYQLHSRQIPERVARVGDRLVRAHQAGQSTLFGGPQP